MTFLFVQFLLWILLGAFAGWLTGKGMKRYGYGPLIDVALGALGSIGGAFIIGAAEFSGPLRMIPSVLVSVLGAVVLTAFMAFVSGERRHAWAGEAMQQGRRAKRGRPSLSQPEDDTLY